MKSLLAAPVARPNRWSGDVMRDARERRGVLTQGGVGQGMSVTCIG
jgi:hypothetical protein